MSDRPQFYTPDEAIKDYFGGKVSRHNIYGALKDKKLKHARVGRRILIKKEDLDAWWDSLTQMVG